MRIPNGVFVLSVLSIAAVLVVMLMMAANADGEAGPLNAGAAGNPYSAFTHGPPADPDYFPIAVWLQSPRNAQRYRAAGINVYVGLWKGPTEDQLSTLDEAGMQVICAQNDVGLAHIGDDTIIGWMHGDEPDNAQPKEGGGYGPPIEPDTVVERYQKMRNADPSRPVLLNLGQGVAWDHWHGRGVRTNHPEDYAEYVKGCDIASFDIYPVVHRSEQVAGNLWFVPRGVQRLREWSNDSKIVWNCIECSRISNTEVKPTPHQVRAEVWMSLIHGSMGLIYFVHQFQPKFVEASVLADDELLPAVTQINQQIHDLAPVLNGPPVDDVVGVESSNGDVPIALMVKQHDDDTYAFAVAMRDGDTTAEFSVRGTPDGSTIDVLGEARTLTIRDGGFEDEFGGYDVHLYRIDAVP